MLKTPLSIPVVTPQKSEEYQMVLKSICERASTAFYFVSREQFRNSNPFSISHVVLVICYSYKNGIRSLLYLPFSTLKG